MNGIIVALMLVAAPDAGTKPSGPSNKEKAQFISECTGVVTGGMLDNGYSDVPSVLYAGAYCACALERSIELGTPELMTIEDIKACGEIAKKMVVRTDGKPVQPVQPAHKNLPDVKI